MSHPWLMMVTMTTNTDLPEQLTLLDEAKVPVQFRLDEATRRRGLAHIAEIRAQLERSRAARATAPGRVRSLPARRPAGPRAA
jgi:hypothetical protein